MPQFEGKTTFPDPRSGTVIKFKSSPALDKLRQASQSVADNQEKSPIGRAYIDLTTLEFVIKALTQAFPNHSHATGQLAEKYNQIEKKISALAGQINVDKNAKDANKEYRLALETAFANVEATYKKNKFDLLSEINIFINTVTLDKDRVKAKEQDELLTALKNRLPRPTLKVDTELTNLQSCVKALENVFTNTNISTAEIISDLKKIIAATIQQEQEQEQEFNTAKQQFLQKLANTISSSIFKTNEKINEKEFILLSRRLKHDFNFDVPSTWMRIISIKNYLFANPFETHAIAHKIGVDLLAKLKQDTTESDLLKTLIETSWKIYGIPNPVQNNDGSFAAAQALQQMALKTIAEVEKSNNAAIEAVKIKKVNMEQFRRDCKWLVYKLTDNKITLDLANEEKTATGQNNAKIFRGVVLKLIQNTTFANYEDMKELLATKLDAWDIKLSTYQKTNPPGKRSFFSFFAPQSPADKLRSEIKKFQEIISPNKNGPAKRLRIGGSDPEAAESMYLRPKSLG